MEKKYIYVLVYDCGGKQVIKCSSANYSVIAHMKRRYDVAMEREGKIKKLLKSP